MVGQNITVFIYAIIPEIHTYITFFPSNNIRFHLWQSVFTLKKYTLLICVWEIVHPPAFTTVTLPVTY